MNTHYARLVTKTIKQHIYVQGTYRNKVWSTRGI
jgi:hypothetical protein